MKKIISLFLFVLFSIFSSFAFADDYNGPSQERQTFGEYVPYTGATSDVNLGAYGAIINDLTLKAATELTISAGGAITITQGFHTVDGAADADDDLDTITVGTFATTGFVLILRPENAARNITIRSGTGNIVTGDGANYTIPDNGIVVLVYDGTDWRVVAGGSSTFVSPVTITSTTTPQLTVGYDGTNKMLVAVGTTGDMVITASGGDISFDNENLSTTGTIDGGDITANGTGPTVNLDDTDTDDATDAGMRAAATTTTAGAEMVDLFLQAIVNGSLVDVWQFDASDAQIEPQYPMVLGAQAFAPDSGNVTWIDMPVTSASVDGTPMSYYAKIDGTTIQRWYMESDGAGGVDTPYVVFTAKDMHTAALSAATGDEVALQLNYTTNKATSGADTGLEINMTDTLSPGTSLPINVKVGSTSKFSVDEKGEVFSNVAEDTDSDTDDVLTTTIADTVYGTLMVRESAGTEACMYLLAGGTIEKISGDATFTVTKDNASTYNVYFESSVIKVQNKVGDNKNIRLGFYGM